MAVISYEIKILKSLQQNLIQENIKLPQAHRIVFCPFGSRGIEDIVFELNGYGTENVALATKFLRLFCLSQVLSSICQLPFASD